MKLSVVIPSRGDQNMKNIIGYLQRQTFKDFEVIFIIDKMLDAGCMMHDEGNIRYIHNLNSTFRTQRDEREPKIGGNASKLRNYGIRAAKGEFLLLMDDDEWFEDDYIAQNISLREKYRAIVKKDFVLIPTLMYRKTGQIQNQGFSCLNYRLSRPAINFLGKKERDYVQMGSGNSIFAPAYIFKQNLFDERLDFVYEDLDFTRGLTYAGYPIVVLCDLKIYHMESDKNKLQQLRIGNEYAAYRKSKHRRIFVSKYGSFRDKIKFYLFGFRGHPGRLILHVFFYGKGLPRRKIIRGIIRGSLN